MSSPNASSSRSWIVFAFCAAFGAGILGQLARIQIDSSDQWSEQQGRHLPQPRTIESMRGQILSTDGHLLATSVPKYALHWDPTVVNEGDFEAELEALCSALARAFPSRDASEYRTLLKRAFRQKKSRYVPVVRDMNYAQKKRVESFPFIGTYSQNKSGFIFCLQFQIETKS